MVVRNAQGLSILPSPYFCIRRLSAQKKKKKDQKEEEEENEDEDEEVCNTCLIGSFLIVKQYGIFTFSYLFPASCLLQKCHQMRLIAEVNRSYFLSLK